MEKSRLPPSMYTIKGILILDNKGNRIWAKYYGTESFCTLEGQRKFETSLSSKTRKLNEEVFLLDGFTVLYKPSNNLGFYVFGDVGENVVLLESALNCIYESISLILRKDVDKYSISNNLGVIMLALDEIVDSGIVLECESSAVVSRVPLKTPDLPFAEQTMAQVI